MFLIGVGQRVDFLDHAQLPHDLPQSLQRRFGFAPSAQDHEIVSIGHEASAEASLKPDDISRQDRRYLALTMF
jgi:hypothetical protein